MRIRTLLTAIGVSALSICLASNASAGPFAEDMAKCLVKSTSPEDRTVLVRWIFAEMALHPDLQNLAGISPQQRADIDAKAGVLVQRLLLEACKTQTREAIANEGPDTIQYAFNVLGQVASRGLFTNPEVAAGLAGLAKSLDAEKLKTLFPAQAPANAPPPAPGPVPGK